jgi:hypothetical protein
MTSRMAVVEPGDAGWTDALAHAPHDVHHVPGWSVASAPLEPGEPLAVRVGGDRGSMLVPFVRRPLDGGRWDAVSPYGYAGPVLTKDVRDPTGLLRAAADHLREEGCASWFLRLHPILDTWVADAADLSAHLREHGQVVSVDLTLGDDQFTAGLRKDHRSDIRRGQSDGLRVRRGDHDADLDTFVALHRGTMAQREADEYHRFGPEYFAALADGLGDDLVVLLAEIDRQAVAGALFTFAASSGIVGYHLAASVPRPPRGATKLLIVEGRQIGRERGCTRLLLGGGLGSTEDALFAFKAGFSPDRHRFRTLRLTLDEGEYARRCAAEGVNVVDTGDYFPAYRRSR